MEPSDLLESAPVRDEVFVLRVRGGSGRARVSVKHVATGRVLTTEDLKDVDDFIRLSMQQERAGERSP